MKRRNFLQATSMLPFFTKSLYSGKLAGESGVTKEIILHQTKGTNHRNFFYRPENAWAADFIPLYANGEFQLFYLLDWRDKKNHGEGTPWYRISTKDFVHFTEHGEMIPRGTKEQQDLYVFTGSAIHAKNQYHIFYTGENPHFKEQGKPEEAVMHAISDDLQNWKKIPEDTFFAPTDIYDKDNWRDPFVFWNEEKQEYNMLLAARFKKGIPRRRGLTALASSKDLTKWKIEEPFYAPGLYFTHECPDLFKIGDWWYLVFSEFTDLVRTRYRMSRSLNGPWIIPENDDFDGHAFYAAKTASDGKKRFIFGWNPTREGGKDNGDWNWGGNLVVHEIHQEKNGHLTVSVPKTVANAFNIPLTYAFEDGVRNIQAKNGVVKINASGTFGAASAGKMPATCKINATVEFDKETRYCGLMLRTSDDLEKSYYIRLDPQRNRLVFDMWPRYHSEVSHMVELDRFLKLTPGVPIKIQVLIDGSVGVAYVNDEIAMDFRAYDLTEGNWGVFASEGNVVFKEINIFSI